MDIVMVNRYKMLNQYAKKGQILFAGSSLMEQFPIYEFIQSFGISKIIYNRGIGGYTTYDLLEVMDVCVFDLEPSKIFLNIGTNDINGADYKEEGLIERYEKIVSQIRSRLPETKLYLMAYYPVNEIADFGNPDAREWIKFRNNKRISSANQAVRKLAEKYNCKFIDVNSGLVDDAGQLKAEYSIEGVHIYPNGYKAVLDELLKYILE